MKVCFETFGCRLNRAEALQEEARYIAAGWEVTKDHQQANRIVVRGCSVTGRAQRDCERTIRHLRHKYPKAKVIVQGCLKDPDARTAKPTAATAATDLPVKTDAVPVPTRTARAYLKVQDGCSGNCTFCIVPQFRGKSVSVDFDKVLDDARRFIDAGYHEIVLTGCNLSLYASHGKRFPDLLAALATLTPPPTTHHPPTTNHQPLTTNHQPLTCRFRIGSLEPGPCAFETIDVLAEHANVCRFLHLPIQSGSDKILGLMQRPYTMKDVDTVLVKALTLLPDLGLGCDLMSGFPGETEIDHLANKALLTRYPFTNIHVFRYSERPKTLAATFPGAIPRDVRTRRAHELARLADERRRMLTKRYAGHSVEVIIEDVEKQGGWTSEYVWFEKAAKVPPAARLPRKSLATFLVARCHNGKLTG